MMLKNDEFIKVYSGTEVTVLLLKDQLEEIGISALIKNDYKVGIDVGFVGGVQSSVDLFIQVSDFDKAEPVIREFTAINKTYQ